METNIVTLSLEEYLRLRKLKEDLELSAEPIFYYYDFGGVFHLSNYQLITKDEAIVKLIKSNHELRMQISRLEIEAERKKKGWFR